MCLVISCNNTNLFHKLLGVGNCVQSVPKVYFSNIFTINKKAVKKQKRFSLLTIISKQHLSNMTVFLKSIKFSWVERSFVKQLFWNSFSFSQTLYDELFLILITLTPTMVQLFSSQTRKCSQNFSGHRIRHQTCKYLYIDYYLKNQTNT